MIIFMMLLNAFFTIFPIIMIYSSKKGEEIKNNYYIVCAILQLLSFFNVLFIIYIKEVLL